MSSAVRMLFVNVKVERWQWQMRMRTWIFATQLNERYSLNRIDSICVHISSVRARVCCVTNVCCMLSVSLTVYCSMYVCCEPFQLDE